jgi:tetratricopeptide (TPR) repeat protein
MQRLFYGKISVLAARKKSHTKKPMSRLRGRSQNRESQESRPGDPGPAFQRQPYGVAKARPRLIALWLALITLLAYLPAVHNGFVVYDDNTYVTENRTVQNGLTWAGMQWAFTTGHGSNWHPLTWLSHMMDCSLFGLNAGAHHSINLLYHAANAVLLLLLLFRLTGALWPAAFVAALFAWHPLHVESVAWISERKDVLSTFFALLTLLAYVRAVRGDKWQVAVKEIAVPADSRFTFHASLFYALALAWFALGLMAKPMLVTLPFVMLLLDCWPLQRFSTLNPQLSTCLRLTLEKWPFFLLVVISCVVTYLAQSHGEAVMTLRQHPLPLRIANALMSYALYLAKMIWPWPLAVFYPLPNHLSWIKAMTAVAVAVLGGFSWLAWRARHQCPYLLMGWLWFLGTLVPVIGLVQVGSAAMADRYTYFPLVGIFIAIAFAARDLASRFGVPKIAVAVAAAVVLAACLALTENQLRYWRDSESLFAHTLAVTADNPNARVDYGVALEQQGRYPEALAEYREAVRIAPDNLQAQYNTGNLLDKMGRPGEARLELLKAVQLDPKSAAARAALGAVLVELGRFPEAMDQFTEAIRLDPNHAGAHFDLGKALLKQGRDPEAIDEFRAALRLDPDNYQILAYTAHVLAADENPQIRDGQNALVLALKANALSGNTQPLVFDALGMACAETGRFEEAQQATQAAIDLATTAGMKKLEPLQQRLELYKNHQPWRESFRATNAPSPP